MEKSRKGTDRHPRGSPSGANHGKYLRAKDDPPPRLSDSEIRMWRESNRTSADELLKVIHRKIEREAKRDCAIARIAAEVLKPSAMIHGGAYLRKSAKPLRKFDEVAGPLWCEAQTRGSGRVLDAQLARIADELDRQDFELKNYLEPKHRRLLGAWNRQNHQRRIKTFRAAIGKHSLRVSTDASAAEQVSEFKPQRAVRRRLSRAGARWRKTRTLDRPADTESGPRPR